MRIFVTIILFLSCLLKIKSFLTTRITNNNKYLTKQEWKYIIENRLLQNVVIKKKINEIVYEKYKKLCYYKVCKFKRLHKYKCKDIKTDELFICAITGLCKSIKNYNGNVELIYYANKYILSELYSVMTKKQQMRNAKSLSSQYNEHNNHHENNDKINEYQHLLESKNNEYTKKMYETQKYVDYWKIINNINNKTTKKIAKYKYNFCFTEIRSNTDISKLMGCSEETIRKHIVFIKNEFKKYISTNPDFLHYAYLL